MKPTTLLLTLLFGMFIVAGPPAMAAREKTKRNITFIVRKADKVKNIAARFHVTPKELTKLNAHLRKGQMAYAGKAIVIPVWLKRKANSTKESSDFNIADYQLELDSLDGYIKEDFVSMADIEVDTMRRQALDKEIKGLDKRLSALYVRYDSVLRAENAEYADLSLRDQKKLTISRMRNNPHASLNADIDALNQQKNTLNGEKMRINMRVTDYENLVENAAYMQAHPEESEQRTFSIRDWGDDPAKVPATSGGRKK